MRRRAALGLAINGSSGQTGASYEAMGPVYSATMRSGWMIGVSADSWSGALRGWVTGRSVRSGVARWPHGRRA